jgi:hypothetical protein
MHFLHATSLFSDHPVVIPKIKTIYCRSEVILKKKLAHEETNQGGCTLRLGHNDITQRR